jgi:hypothetical protein
LNNTDNIALIINNDEVTSLMFNENRNSGYEDLQLDLRTNLNFTPKTVLLSIGLEQEKEELQKQINNYNKLISENMTLIKNKQNENRKNRNEVKKLIRKLDEFIQKDPFILMNNSSSSSSPYSVLRRNARIYF